MSVTVIDFIISRVAHTPFLNLGYAPERYYPCLKTGNAYVSGKGMRALIRKAREFLFIFGFSNRMCQEKTYFGEIISVAHCQTY